MTEDRDRPVPGRDDLGLLLEDLACVGPAGPAAPKPGTVACGNSSRPPSGAPRPGGRPSRRCRWPSPD